MSLSDEELDAVQERADAAPYTAVTAPEMVAVGVSQGDVKPLLYEVRELRAIIGRVRDVTDRMHDNAIRALNQQGLGYYTHVAFTTARADAEAIRAALEGTDNE